MTALNRKTASGITRDGHDLSPQPLGVIEFRNKRELATPIVDNLDVLGSGRAGRRWNQLSPESPGIGHEGLRTRWKREMSHAVVDPRRHDFLIAVPGRPDAAVEVKALDPSDDAILSYRLHMENSPMFSRGSVPDDRTVCVQMKEELRVAVADPSRHAWLKKQIPAAKRALGRAFEDLASKGFSFGEWPAMGGGMLAVVPRTEGPGSVTFSLGDEKASEKQAGRILIPLEKAARKPRRSGTPSVAFIHVPRLSETLVREAVEDDLTRRPDKYQNLDGLIIRTVRQVVDDGFPPYEEWRAWARPTGWGNISADDLNVLGRGLTESRFRLSLPRWVARKNESD